LPEIINRARNEQLTEMETSNEVNEQNTEMETSNEVNEQNPEY
jgi:hypothetical protein